MSWRQLTKIQGFPVGDLFAANANEVLGVLSLSWVVQGSFSVWSWFSGQESQCVYLSWF